MQKRKTISKKTRQFVYDKLGGHCAYCGKKIEIKDMQIDHVYPLKLQYKTFDDLDVVENMLPACRKCNRYKYTLTLSKFRKRIEELTENLERNSVAYRNAVSFNQVIPNKHKQEFYFEKVGFEIDKRYLK